MAVINTGSIVNDIRGSVGTETYARGQGGLYVRARTTPTDPNTAPQQACRAAVTALSQYWSGTLTEQQRIDWRSYAHQHPRPNRWGELTITNGYTRFVRINFHRYRLWQLVTFTSPPPSPPIHPPIFTFSANCFTEEIVISLNLPTYDPPPMYLRLWAFAGITVNPGRNFYNGPWQYLDTNLYTGTWTTDPWIIDTTRPTDEAHKIFVKLIAQQDNTGELSAPYQTFATISD